jgi:hypothetical protein
VKLVDTHEHFGSVKLCVFFLQNTRVVEQSSEISSGYVFLLVSCLSRIHVERRTMAR